MSEHTYSELLQVYNNGWILEKLNCSCCHMQYTVLDVTCMGSCMGGDGPTFLLSQMRDLSDETLSDERL